MKRIYYSVVLALIIVVGTITSCKESFLEITPNGALDIQVLATNEGIQFLLIGAYSMVDGVAQQGGDRGGNFEWNSTTSGWVFGSIRGMEANKGTDSGDQPDINPIQTFSETSTNPYLNIKWRAIYEGVSRCNSVISTTNLALEKGTITEDEANLFLKQARTLRGFYHFEAWRLWANASTGIGIPYVTEVEVAAGTVTNDRDVRPDILADLDQGRTLPNNMGQVGRFNGTVAKVLWAKAQMQMYKDYAAALPVLQDVEANGTNPAGQKAGLMAKYGDIFDIANRNGIESIYTVQYSVNDGSGGYNAGFGEVLNFPYKGGGSPGGCCGFFNPTQEFVNSFRTQNGLPMSDTQYNANADFRDQGVSAGPIWSATAEYVVDDAVTVYAPGEPYIDRVYISLTGTVSSPNVGNNPLTSTANWELQWVEDNSRPVDPRLDWTAGRRGIPYLDWGVHTGRDWIRDQTYSGPYNPKKQVYRKSQEGTFTEVGNWTSGWTANGYRLIRYADVILMIAECKAILGQGDLGLAEVNRIRARAANSDGFVKEEDGTTNAANYQINPYSGFADQAAAIRAIQMERKLELGMEGHRYYDLQRWGNVVSEITRIHAYENTMPWAGSLYAGFAIGPEDVNFPIPQRQIDISTGNLVQNR